MKSRITKLTTAAAVIIAVIVGIYSFNGSIDIATVALAQVTENMKKMSWMVIKTRNPAGTAEQWISFPSKYWIAQDGDGVVTCYDYKQQKQYRYEPSSNTLTIDYLRSQQPLMLTSSLFALEKVIEQINEVSAKSGKKTKKKAGKYNGRKVEIYDLSFSEKGLHNKGTVYIDNDRKLVIAVHGTSYNPAGQLVFQSEMEFSYPENGPESVYDLGVPESATVVNSLPSNNVQNVLTHYQAHRINSPEKYMAIIKRQRVSYGVRIVYRDRDLIRTELRRAISLNDWDNVRVEAEKEFGSLWQWWNDDNNTELKSIYLYDGLHEYSIEGLPDNKRSERYEYYFADWHGAIDYLGWPKIENFISDHTQTRIIENDYSRENGLVCIEIIFRGIVKSDGMVVLPRNFLYYIDSEHDYICVRHDFLEQKDIYWEGKDNSWLEGIDADKIPIDKIPQMEIITELGRTRAGKWFPRMIVPWVGDETDESNRRWATVVYLHEDPEFPAEIFDPENLPK